MNLTITGEYEQVNTSNMKYMQFDMAVPYAPPYLAVP